MKTTIALLALGLLAGCSSPTTDQTTAMPDTADPAAPAPRTEAPPAPPAAATAAATASATGVVESVDMSARTVTIAHGPVASLQWPAMTMTFQAPGADLGAIKVGDRVTFQFTANGMDGTIVSMTK